MNPIIHQRPEPICETLALLYLSENLEIMIRLLGAIDSEAGDELAFYREHEGLHRKYVAAFREKAVHDEYFNFFFRDMCVNDYLIMILPFLMDKNLPFDAEERSEEALRRLLEESYLFIYNSGGYLERISQCESSDFNAYIEAGMSGDELRAVAERPSLYLTALARLIRKTCLSWRMRGRWCGKRRSLYASSWSSAAGVFFKGHCRAWGEDSAHLSTAEPLHNLLFH